LAKFVYLIKNVNKHITNSIREDNISILKYSLKQQHKRSLQCAILSFGSPLGWLFIRYLQGLSPKQQLLEESGLYLYLFIGTLVSFASFGWYVGNAEQNIKNFSIIDALTKCFNFRYFHERFADELQRAMRSDLPLSLLILDIDKFKNVNDQFGHHGGDKVLVKMCEVIAENLRSYEILCRVGGEEFAIITIQSPLKTSIDIAQRISKKIKSQSIDLDDGKQTNITISIGVATFQLEDTIDSMIARAYKALYYAKKNGRDCVVDESTLHTLYSKR
jgi:diguanylate cyclase (GGDEF)-like protein